jgi:ankyrin repeat protein
MTKRLLIGSMAVLLASIVGLSQTAAPKAPNGAVADAVARGDKAALQSLLAQKADVNGTQVDGTTALHWAVYKNDVATVDQLIKAGAKVAVSNRQNTTPLLMAATYGNPEIVSRLLKAGADAKALGPNNETTLMLAARSGNPATIKLLLAAGVPVNAKEPLRGTTALMWAAEQSHPEAVKALLDGGADFTVRANGAGTGRAYMSPAVNNSGITAARQRLTVLKESGVSIEDQIKAAATAGGGRGGGGGGGNNQGGGQGGQGGNAQGGRGGRGGNNAQAGAAAGGGNQPAAGAGAAGGQQPAAGAGNNAGGGRGGRGGQGGGQQAAGGNNAGGGRGGRGGGQGGATQTAAAADDAEEEDEEDAAPQAGLSGQAGGGGLTALSYAARQGDLQSAKYLLAAGANINQTTSGGWTPLLTATNNRNYQFGKYLVQQGADVNIANNGQNFSPLYLAVDNRNIEGGDFPVPKADMDHLEYIKTLLDAGAKVDHRVSTNTETRTIFTNHWFFEPGTTAFVRAAQSGDLALMKMLMAYGADPKAKNDYGDTALSAVAGIGWVEGVTYEHSPQESVEVVKMLLDLGLDPNSTNRDLRTPLMGAAHKGRNEIIQLLVDRGGKLDMRDKGSRDTDKGGAIIAGHSWIALDYADGLVRVGVQSANPHPESAKLIRKLMSDRGMFVPPENRDINSICIVDICQERKLEFLAVQP